MNLYKQLANFVYELGHLRRIKHEGWRLAGVRDPESVAAHSLRAAQIGYFLGKLENYKDPKEIVLMLVFHDSGECRIGDIHKVANSYIEADEERAVNEQMTGLGELGAGMIELWQDFEYGKSEAGIIAKDADLLEQAALAKEYMEQGYPKMENWLNKIAEFLQTESAKKLLTALNETESTDWWQELKNFD